ncbi:MAG: glycosyltransferase family 2 protein [Polyangiales bacterium]
MNSNSHAEQPDLSVVILSWNTRALTASCIDALLRDRAQPECETTREIIVVDNGSEDDSADYIAAHYPDVVLVRNPDNRLYAEGNNQGASVATGRWLCTLNSDAEVKPGALDTLVRWLVEHPDYGAASPKLVNLDGSVQPECRRFPGLLDVVAEGTQLGRLWPFSSVAYRTRMRDFDHLTSRDVDQPPGAVMMFDREEYLSYGGLDPELSLFFNDVDICNRLWADGRRIRYVAEAEVVHHGGASTTIFVDKNNDSLWFKNRETYFHKHFGEVGRRWTRGAFMLWSTEYALGVSLSRRRSLAEKATELKVLRQHMRDCLR